MMHATIYMYTNTNTNSNIYYISTNVCKILYGIFINIGSGYILCSDKIIHYTHIKYARKYYSSKNKNVQM